jgi:hypothetical protein
MPYFVVGPDGRESGPYELDALVAWVRDGQLPRHAPVRDSGAERPVPAGQMIELAAHFPPMPPGAKGSAMMPTGNPDALWGYYLGWLSLLCMIGLPLAPFAFVKSMKGLRAYQADPSIYGKAHAVTGIVLASIGTLGNLFLWGLVIVGLGQ